MADDGTTDATASAKPEAKPKEKKPANPTGGSSSSSSGGAAKTVPKPSATSAFSAQKDKKVIIPVTSKKGVDFKGIDFKVVLATLVGVISSGMVAADGGSAMDAIYTLLEYQGPNILYLRQLMLAFLFASADQDDQNPNRPQAMVCFIYVCACVYIRGIKFTSAMKKMSDEGKALLQQCMNFFAPIMTFPEEKFGAADYQVLTPSRLVICFPDIFAMLAVELNPKVNRFGTFLPAMFRFPGSITLIDKPSEAFINAYDQMMYHYDQLINAKKQRNAKQVREAIMSVISYRNTSMNSQLRSGAINLVACPTSGLSGEKLVVPEVKKAKKDDDE